MKIGIDLGGSHIEVGLVYEGKILDSIDKNFKKEEMSSIKDVIVENSISMIKKICKKQKIDLKDIESIGIAAPGLVSKRAIIKSSNLGLYDFELCQILETNLGIPARIRNDAKCAAIAEKEYGALKNYNDALFLCLGTGIGGAAFLNGKMLEPELGAGFEFGHMVIEKDGRECSCGKKGCFERYASIKTLKTRIVRMYGESEDMSGQSFRHKFLYNPNEEVKKEVENYLNYLKIGLRKLN